MPMDTGQERTTGTSPSRHLRRTASANDLRDPQKYQALDLEEARRHAAEEVKRHQKAAADAAEAKRLYAAAAAADIRDHHDASTDVARPSAIVKQRGSWTDVHNAQHATLVKSVRSNASAAAEERAAGQQRLPPPPPPRVRTAPTTVVRSVAVAVPLRGSPPTPPRDADAEKRRRSFDTRSPHAHHKAEMGNVGMTAPQRHSWTQVNTEVDAALQALRDRTAVGTDTAKPVHKPHTSNPESNLADDGAAGAPVVPQRQHSSAFDARGKPRSSETRWPLQDATDNADMNAPSNGRYPEDHTPSIVGMAVTKRSSWIQVNSEVTSAFLKVMPHNAELEKAQHADIDTHSTGLHETVEDAAVALGEIALQQSQSVSAYEEFEAAKVGSDRKSHRPGAWAPPPPPRPPSEEYFAARTG